MIDKGLRIRYLGTETLWWGDLTAIVHHLPRHSALVRELQGEDHVWGLPEQLLAAVVDALNGANWQRGGGKRSDKPKPIPRPGVVEKNKIGKGAVSMEEMDDFLGWSKELEKPEPVRPVDKLGKLPRKRDARGRFCK